MPMREMAGGPRVLLKRLRELMAEALEPQPRLDRIVREIAANMARSMSCAPTACWSSTPPRA
jgi:signal transduction protein with GAF and PtsI domain